MCETQFKDCPKNSQFLKIIMNEENSGTVIQLFN